MMDVIFALEDRGNKRIVSCVADLRGVLLRGIMNGTALNKADAKKIADEIADTMATESVFICEIGR
jgi:hypothetical protein